MKIEYWKMLNEQEQEEVQNHSAKIFWGFNETSIRELFKRYMEGDLKEKAKVCYLLEDCNYHELCRLLAEGKIADADRWIEKEFPLEEVETPQSNQKIEVWVMEGRNGEYLHINTTEDANGTWWDWTYSIFSAYWNESLENLKEIAEIEFSDFKEGYPKFHKVRFTAEILETAQDD